MFVFVVVNSTIMQKCILTNHNIFEKFSFLLAPIPPPPGKQERIKKIVLKNRKNVN